ncbi:MAG: glucosidase [Planctomycetota bacterium]
MPTDPNNGVAEAEANTAEKRRLAEEEARVPGADWKKWGPYLSERQWGTVREDYSPNGTCWDYFPHDHARSRAYRWGEDGLLGITDRQCRLCFGLALWNGNDKILKERLFGLSGHEGNHGEDVKECYYYLASTPSHSYMKGLYKYPQAEFPYDQLVGDNRRRSREDDEYELIDTGIFDGGRYFDVTAEYAKASDNDVLIRITVANRGPAAATIHLLPQFWYRNTWSWGCDSEGCWSKPRIFRNDAGEIICEHEALEKFHLAAGDGPNGKAPKWLFTENETNYEKLYGSESPTKFVKDGFHRYVVDGDKTAVRAKPVGTKAAAYYRLRIPKRSEVTVELRMTIDGEHTDTPFGPGFDEAFAARTREHDEYYDAKFGCELDPEERNVLIQAYAGLLWTKQFYHYVVEDWIEGDPAQPPVAAHRKHGRNHDWPHLFNRDIISMPDKWEYPWYAAWDSAFHMIPFAGLDPSFAKEQLVLFLREWYMHPNGQIPAYEFAFSDVNPPVHAWSVWRVYQMTKAAGIHDRKFLVRCFHKLLLNFTWWVNRKDPQGNNLFAGGFLGLDNIGVFDRSKPLPDGKSLAQADGTAWMAFYCSSMLSIAFELAAADRAYADIASKFFEHYISIADAMNTLGGTGLWDEEDGFYYDKLHGAGQAVPLKIRSIVGLIPLFTVDVIEESVLERLPGFKKRTEWFERYRGDRLKNITYLEKTDSESGVGKRLMAVPTRERLEKMLAYMLDEDEFLSPYGIRSLSKIHEKQPFTATIGGEQQRVSYVPGESNTWMFGGNSNWRGPIWFPINYLIVESLERYHDFYGDSFMIECPTGSGQMMTLGEVAREIEFRLLRLFLPDHTGRRPCHGDDARYADDPHWKELILFYEYFHGDSGRGCGASHQTGWTALSAFMLEQLVRSRSARSLGVA